MAGDSFESRPTVPAGRNAGFAARHEWLALLRSEAPQAFATAARAWVQASPWVHPADGRALRAEFWRLAARQRADQAPAWVHAAFALGGDDGLAALEAHAHSPDAGSAESRALADAYARRLRDERDVTQRLDARGSAVRSQARRLPLESAVAAAAGAPRARILGPTELVVRLAEMPLAAHRDALIADGYAPVFATDLDGTTWRGDIGEAVFAMAVRERLLLPAVRVPLANFLERYGFAVTDRVHEDAATLLAAFEDGSFERHAEQRGIPADEARRDRCAASLWCFTGHTVAQLKTWARALFDAPQGGFAGLRFAGVQDVIDAFREQGFETCAVSASNQYVVEVAAEYLGIPPRHCRGIRCLLDDGCITPRILPPVTYGPGKVEAVQEMTGGLPAAAAGDSVDATDRELLDTARLAIAVEPAGNKHVGSALRRGMLILDYAATESGLAADTFVAPWHRARAQMRRVLGAIRHWGAAARSHSDDGQG